MDGCCLSLKKKEIQMFVESWIEVMVVGQLKATRLEVDKVESMFR